MTRGRAGNTAHLVTQDPETVDPVADAREQWVAVFARDRADLGPAHAAEQAAREAANYARPRPLDQALAELREAWTVEQDCLERLARDELRARQLRQIVAIRAEQDATLPTLKAEAQHSSQVAEAAAVRLEHTGAVVAQDAGRLRDALLRDWDHQRPATFQAAQTIAAGTGRFGGRRHQVADARDSLEQWAVTWQPYLSDLPTDSAALAQRAATIDHRPAVWDAFDHWARQRSAQLHPEHAVAEHAAQHARVAERDAHTAYRDASPQYSARLASHGASAIAAQPADRLTREREHLQSQRDTERQAAAAARAHANAADHARRDPALDFAASQQLHHHQPQHGADLGL